MSDVIKFELCYMFRHRYKLSFMTVTRLFNKFKAVKNTIRNGRTERKRVYTLQNIYKIFYYKKIPNLHSGSHVNDQT